MQMHPHANNCTPFLSLPGTQHKLHKQGSLRLLVAVLHFLSRQRRQHLAQWGCSFSRSVPADTDLSNYSYFAIFARSSLVEQTTPATHLIFAAGSDSLSDAGCKVEREPR